MSTEETVTNKTDLVLEEKREPTLLEDFNPKRRELAESYKHQTKKIGRILGVTSLIVTFLIIISQITVFLKLQLQLIFMDEILVIGAFFTVIFTVIGFIELPISYWVGLRIDRKYNLVKLTNKAWLWRYFKAEAISFVLGLIFIEIFYFVLRTFPTTWWIIATIVVIFVSVILSNLAPILVLPLFYKFEPLKNNYPQLTAELTTMMEEERVKITNSFVWKLGEVATTGNAAILGMGKARRIIIADTILEQYTPAEIKLTLAHELGHLKHHDL
ncbi:MAG: M48 family metalloprotease, partial [Candidatus Hodarchaeota archaeon]